MNQNPNEKITVDLDLNNYSLEDILGLFQLQENFNEADLKKAKNQVLRLHPDKSRLDPKYFLFYSKAYKTLFSIWEFKNKNDKKTLNTDEYIPLNTSEEDKNKALETFFDQNKTLKNAKNFNKWFNEQFEKQKVKSDEDESGYGSWLKSNDDIDNTKVTNMRAMGEHIDKRKKEVRAMIVHKGVQDLNASSSGGSNLLDGPQENYSSDVFSSVGFQDLKQAHVESVIPVSNEDYDNIKKFGNVNEFVSYRNNQNTVPLSELQAQQYLAQREKNESSLSTKRAYELAKQTEAAQEKNNEFWGRIMKIDDKRR